MSGVLSKTLMDLRQPAAREGLISARYKNVALQPRGRLPDDALVLDDAPAAVRLAILLSPGLPLTQ
jgi:hypothetical protein